MRNSFRTATTANNSANRNSAINAYLAVARRYPVLTVDEELELCFRMKQGDESAKQALVNHNLRFIYSLACKYASDDDVNDLISVATIGMYTAMEKYDATVGTRFLTYAVHDMLASVMDYARDNEICRRHSGLTRLTTKANRIANKYFAENGRWPTDCEIVDILAEEYNIEVKNNVDIIKATYVRMDAKVGTDEDADTYGEVGEIATATASINGYEADIEADANTALVKSLMGILDERERTIISYFFGLDGKDERDEEWISENVTFRKETSKGVVEMHLTRERVRQIKVGALAKMTDYAGRNK